MDPSIPISYEDLKAKCRAGLPDSVIGRVKWWPVLPSLNKGDAVYHYPDVIGSAERLLALLSIRSPANLSETNEISVSERFSVLSDLFARKSGVQCKLPLRYLESPNSFLIRSAFLCVLQAKT
jgi:hypothetical protein